jgi:membrane fusion protein (multidrug efflux system)
MNGVFIFRRLAKAGARPPSGDMKLVFVIGAVPLFLLGAACQPKAGKTAASVERPPQRVEVAELTREDLRESLEVTGTIEANESVSIQPELAGIVREIAFVEGQAVEKGALLARIDDSELRAQLAEAEARADLARINRERADALAQDRTLAQAEVDRVRSEERAALAVLELLRVRLERTRIFAPSAGVLGARRLSVGDYATSASVLTTLDDVSVLKVSFLVPERSIPQVRPGTLVSTRIRVGADPRPVEAEGEVFFVSASMDPSVRASEAKAVLRAPPAMLRPGMFASVRILLSIREGVLVAPEAALLAGAQGVQLVAVDEAAGRPVARFVDVETGLRVGERVEVRPVLPDSLAPGARIVAAGVGALVLFPGAPIDPTPVRVVLKPLGSSTP